MNHHVLFLAVGCLCSCTIPNPRAAADGGETDAGAGNAGGSSGELPPNASLDLGPWIGGIDRL